MSPSVCRTDRERTAQAQASSRRTIRDYMPHPSRLGSHPGSKKSRYHCFKTRWLAPQWTSQGLWYCIQVTWLNSAVRGMPLCSPHQGTGVSSASRVVWLQARRAQPLHQSLCLPRRPRAGGWSVRRCRRLSIQYLPSFSTRFQMFYKILATSAVLETV